MQFSSKFRRPGLPFLRRHALWLTTAMVAGAVAVPALHAQDWNDATAGGDWNVPANWTPAGVPNDNTAQPVVPAAVGGPHVIDLGGGTFTVNRLTLNGGFDVANGTLTLDGAPAPRLDLAGAGTSATVSADILAPVEARLRAVELGSALTVSGVITAPEGVLIAGAGTVTLSGANAIAGDVRVAGTATLTLAAPGGDTVSGSRVRSGGTVVLASNQTFASLAGGGDVMLGANTLTLTGETNSNASGTISGAGGSVVLTGGTHRFSGNNTYDGGTTIQNSRLDIETFDGAGTGALTLDNATLRARGTFALAQDINVAAGSTATFFTNAGETMTLSGDGNIGAGVTLVLDGPGTMVAAFSGGGYAGAVALDVRRGTLVLGNAGVADGLLGDANVTGVEIRANATVDVNGFATNIRNITGRGTLTNEGAADATVSLINDVDADFRGTIQDGATNSLALVTSGAAVLTLSGNNTFSGGIEVASGTLRLASDTAAGTGTITTTGSVIDYANGVNIANPIVIASNTTQLQVNAGTATQSGVISEDVAGRPLEKIGNGTLILTNVNTYTGTTTISAGTLALANAGSTLVDTNAVVVNAPGTLRLDADETLGSISGAGTINLQANTLTIGGGGDPVTTFSGSIGGAGGALAIAGGDTTLTGANSYTGGTTVSGGALTISGAGTLGAAGSDVTVSGGALTVNNAQNVTVAISGGTLDGTGSVTNIAQTGGAVTVASARRAAAVGGTVTAVGANGIDASNTGAGAVAIVTTAAGAVNNAAGVGVRGSTAGGGNTGAVSVATGAAVTGTTAGILVETETGNATVAANADVTGTAGRGIDVATNGGAVDITIGATSTVTGQTAEGIAVVSNGGSVTVQGSSGDVVGATDGIATNSGDGAILVQNLDSVTGNAGSGLNLTSGGGMITVAAVDAITGTGGNGILANSGGGAISIQDSGTVGGVTGTTGAGIAATAGGGNIGIGNTAVNGNVSGSTFGVFAETSGGGTVAIHTTGATVTGTAEDGIFATTGTGAVTITTGGNVTGGVAGIAAGTTTGPITIAGSGTILGADSGIEVVSTGAANISIAPTGAVTGTATTGIRAQSTGGNIDIAPTGTVDGGQRGIDAITTGAGTVTVTTTAALGGTIVPTVVGIQTSAVDGNTVLTIGAALTSGGIGVDAQSDGGDISVIANGDVTGSMRGIQAQTITGGIAISGANAVSASAAGSAGILARIVAGAGDLAVSTTGAVTNTGTGISDGVDAVNSGSGAVTVTGTGPITLGAAPASVGTGVIAVSAGGGDVTVAPAGTIDGGARGILAQSNGGGTVTVTTAAALGGTTAFAGNGIETRAVDGDTLITVGGNITANEDGINARASGSGNITITGAGNITGDAAGTGNPAFDGIDAQTASGNIVIDVNGTITGAPGINATSTLGGDITIAGAGAVSDVVGAAILATTTGGNGNVSVNRDGNVDGGATGVLASAAGTGDVAVTAGAGNRIRGGVTGVETAVDSGTATITVAAGATVESGLDPAGVVLGADSAAISATTGALGSTVVNNAGTVQATNTADSLGLRAAGAGGFTFNNAAGGVGTGMMASGAGAGAVTVNNAAVATWTLNANGSSVMAGGNDTLNNSGIFNASMNSSLTGWEAINNDGTINLMNGATLGGAGAAIANAGAINATGTTTLIGNLDNTGGTVTIADGSATNVMNLTGNLAGGGGTLNLDVDLTTFDAGFADRLAATGNAAGNLTLNLNSVGALSLQPTPIVLLQAADVSGLNVTANAIGFTLGAGLISYNVVNNADNDEVQLVGAPSPIIGGVASNVAIVQALVGSVINRPSGAFVSGLQVDTPNNCAAGGWARLTGGHAGATTTTSSGIFNTPSRVRASYAGVQGGFDFGCYEDFIDGWDLTAGVTFGGNFGESRQAIFALDGAGMPVGPVVSNTTASFDQTYAGAYFAFFRQNLGGDMQIRRDSTKFVFNNVPVAAPPGDMVDVEYRTRATTLSGSASYFHKLNDSLSVVPAAGFSVSRSTGGRLTFTDAAGSTLDVHKHTSKLVFGGATLVNTTISDAGDSATSHFVTATVYSDISGVRRSTFTPGGGGAPFDLETRNLGTFGELSVGVGHIRVLNGQSAGAAKQLDASIRADARISNRLQAVGLTAQVRFKF